MSVFAINFMLGGRNQVLVVDAPDRDEAYSRARNLLLEHRFVSASLQGSCRLASQEDLDNATITSITGSK